MQELIITIKRSNLSGAVSIKVEGDELPGDREMIMNHSNKLVTALANGQRRKAKFTPDWLKENK